MALSTTRGGYEGLKGARYSLSSVSVSNPRFSLAPSLSRKIKMQSATLLTIVGSIYLEDLSNTTSLKGALKPFRPLQPCFSCFSHVIFSSYSSILNSLYLSVFIGIQSLFSMKHKQNNTLLATTTAFIMDIIIAVKKRK